MNRESVLEKLLKMFPSVTERGLSEILSVGMPYENAQLLSVHQDENGRSISVFTVHLIETSVEEDAKRYLVRVCCPAGILEQLFPIVPFEQRDILLACLLRQATDAEFESVIRPFGDLWLDPDRLQKFTLD